MLDPVQPLEYETGLILARPNRNRNGSFDLRHFRYMKVYPKIENERFFYFFNISLEN